MNPPTTLERLDDLCERVRAHKSLPEIKHTGDQDARRSAEIERLTVEVKMMKELIEIMDEASKQFKESRA